MMLATGIGGGRFAGRVAGVGRHLRQDGAAAIDLGADQAHVFQRVAFEVAGLAFQLLGDDGDGGQRRRQLVRGAGGQRGQRRQALAARGVRAFVGQRLLALRQRAADARDEVADEAGGDPERDPHALHVHLHVLLWLCAPDASSFRNTLP